VTAVSTAGRGGAALSTSVVSAMNIDPAEIRAEIDALLAQLPEDVNSDHGMSIAELEEIARRLSEAHDVLLRALESAEKG
jgi:hypothetical protein